MKKILFAIGILLPFVANAGPGVVYGQPFPFTPGTSQPYPLTVNSAGQITTTLSAGEDQTNGVMKVEGQFSYKGNLSTDTQIKASAGFVHTLTCQGTDGTATAGTIILYDNTAESGAQIYHLDVQAAAYNSPATVVLDAVAATGLYLGFTTTADVTCTVTYR